MPASACIFCASTYDGATAEGAAAADRTIRLDDDDRSAGFRSGQRGDEPPVPPPTMTMSAS